MFRLRKHGSHLSTLSIEWSVTFRIANTASLEQQPKQRLPPHSGSKGTADDGTARSTAHKRLHLDLAGTTFTAIDLLADTMAGLRETRADGDCGDTDR